MRIIKPSFQILNQESGMDGLLKHIELCGRTAYKSEDLITEDSAPRFTDMLIVRGHGAVLEHGTVYLKIPVGSKSAYTGVSLKYSQNKYSSSFYNEGYAYITTNYRVLIESYDWLSDLYFQCEPTEFHHKRITVKFTCDRGVSHEFVRHRVFSFVQESTRYCNYSKDKFESQITCVLPPWLAEDNDSGSPSDGYLVWIDAMVDADSSYEFLIKEGWPPQQARSILPNSLKTELIMTGTVDQWKGFFKLRCAPDAHPQARELAVPLEEKFKELGYVG